MSDGILTITGFGRFEKLHAAYNKLVVENQKLKDALKGVEAQSKKTDDAQESALNSMMGKAGKLLGMYVSIQSAVSLANAAIQKQIELSEKAATQNLTLADAQKDFSSAMGPAASLELRRSSIKEFQDLAVSLGFTEAQGLRVGSQVMNSVIDPDPARRMRTAKEIFRASAPFFSPMNSDELAETAAAVGDISKGLPGVSVQDLMAMQMAFLGSSRARGAATLPNTIQAISSAQISSPFVKDQLRNTQQAYAILAGLSSRMGDADLELSRTAAAGLFGVVRNTFGEFGKELPIMDAIKKARTERPDLIKKAGEDLLGRVFTKDPQREILRGGTTDILADIAMGEFDVTQNQWRQFKQFAIDGTPEIAEANSVRKAMAEQTRANKPKATEGSIRAKLFGGQLGEEEMPGLFPSINKGWRQHLDTMYMRAMFEAYIMAGMDPTVAGIAVLRGARESYANMDYYQNQGWVPKMPNMFTSSSPQEAKRREKAIDDMTQSIIGLPAIVAEVNNGNNAQAAAAQRGAQVE